MIGFFLVALLLFSIALYGAGYYLWSVPQQEATDELGNRLRGVRTSMRSRAQAPELLRKEHRGSFAFLGDLVTWVGVLRRLQELIEQANLKYRAADVFGLSVLLGVGSFLALAVFGGGVHFVHTGTVSTIRDGVTTVSHPVSVVVSNLLVIQLLL